MFRNSNLEDLMRGIRMLATLMDDQGDNNLLNAAKDFYRVNKTGKK